LPLLNLTADNPRVAALRARLERHLQMVEARLGEAPYFAGQEFDLPISAPWRRAIPEWRCC
jgi:glutathione S-transferase